ncbi:MAG TPA: DUF3558 domain-containing protein [Pseudonocardiaceae bacterium]|nr:DUF3558 domain-containing protein [Pseudonocardiaceae bacterium]
MNRARLAAPLGAALVFGAAGCAPASAPPALPGPPPTSAAPTSSPFPPRPAELRLDGVDPCRLLIPANVGQLDVKKVGQHNDADQFGSLDCLWANHSTPDISWLARAIVKQGADYALGNTAPVQVVQVGGFSAVQTSSPYQNANTECILAIDVARGENLWVQFDNRAGDFPGIDHQVACQQASKAAELMLRNLRGLAH